MKYYIFNIDDSGAVEDIDEKNVDGKNIPICKMYDDSDFNKLNDILHCTNAFILNKKALNIFKECNTIPYKTRNAKVLRKEKILGFLKKYKAYDYHELIFPDKGATECYNWIDFIKSEVYAIDNSTEERFKIKSHQQKLELIENNKSDSDKSYSFEVKKIFFGKNFDSDIDLFKIPYYSWGEYVSERLKNKLRNAEITDIGFAESKEELGKMWKPHFPIIEFEK